ncbi:hypothetical protein SVA_0348 [Sulfurifustis variabilis]|uniref:Uncharacterized protein n=1 Tax=Sulfurifustis variabilis TaxID=1675686 RepID=A0A1B4V0G2_9GAMM|nr:hypothetical protein [Sulfurifustis variabilis]BAU46930.1 hypothetical protein SVA_0348 [Sulfurifustis variabilis]
MESESASAGNAVLRWARRLGPLRIALLAAAVLVVVFAPAPGTKAVYHGWGLARTVLMPVLAPLVVMLLLLDALMARVFLSDAEGEARARLRTVVWINLLVALALVLYWIPYFYALGP